MLKYSLPALVIGFVLDLLIGDPRWLYHPICVIGNLIAVLEKVIRKIFPKNHGGELTGGFLIVVLVCLFSGGGAASGALLSLPVSAGGRICAGGFLVLSASCHPFPEG